MAKIEKFEDIDAWRRARNLTKIVYRVSAGSRFSRDYGLRDQVRNAAVSIMANIAEGFDCGSDREFMRFLGYALRSASEVQSHLYVALDQEYVSPEVFSSLFGDTVAAKSCILGFIRYSRSHTNTRS